MICPRCETEYPEGISQCADCKIPLAEKIDAVEPKENPFDISNAVEILRVLNFSEVVFIKSLLESENIGYAFLDETAMSKTWGGVKARLLVNNRDRDKAVALLKAADIL